MANQVFHPGKPEFEHDCDACLFLAHYQDHDLYVCGDQDRASLIARYSNDGPDYKSNDAAMVTQLMAEGYIHSREHLAVAHLLAELAGRIPSCG
jgi:hypothetical protein